MCKEVEKTPLRGQRNPQSLLGCRVCHVDFGFCDLAGDSSAHSIVLTALRFNSLTGSGAIGCKHLNCIGNLSHLTNGGPSSTHLRQIRAAASVMLSPRLQAEPVTDTSLSRRRSRSNLLYFDTFRVPLFAKHVLRLLALTLIVLNCH